MCVNALREFQRSSNFEFGFDVSSDWELTLGSTLMFVVPAVINVLSWMVMDGITWMNVERACGGILFQEFCGDFFFTIILSVLFFAIVLKEKQGWLEPGWWIVVIFAFSFYVVVAGCFHARSRLADYFKKCYADCARFSCDCCGGGGGGGCASFEKYFPVLGDFIPVLVKNVK